MIMNNVESYLVDHLLISDFLSDITDEEAVFIRRGIVFHMDPSSPFGNHPFNGSLNINTYPSQFYSNTLLESP